MLHLSRVNPRLCRPKNIVYEAIFNENIIRHTILSSTFFSLSAMKIEFHHLFASTVAVDKSDHFLGGTRALPSEQGTSRAPHPLSQTGLPAPSMS